MWSLAPSLSLSLPAGGSSWPACEVLLSLPLGHLPALRPHPVLLSRDCRWGQRSWAGKVWVQLLPVSAVHKAGGQSSPGGTCIYVEPGGECASILHTISVCALYDIIMTLLKFLLTHLSLHCTPQLCLWESYDGDHVGGVVLFQPHLLRRDLVEALARELSQLMATIAQDPCLPLPHLASLISPPFSSTRSRRTTAGRH